MAPVVRIGPPEGGLYRKDAAKIIRIQAMTQPLRVLFVCRLNRNRSATAERLFCKRQDLDVRSAGTNEEARVQVNERMMDWADMIFAMDSLEEDNLKEMFPNHSSLARIVCLDIPDQFGFNDPELVRLLTHRVELHLTKGANSAGGARSKSPKPS
jgi:predicted protein tyrosine phosphatase